jgi:hypothetical protein
MKTRYARAPEVLWRNVGSEALLARSDAEDVEMLSPTAAIAWRLLDAPATLAQLTEILTAGYGESRDAIERDVRVLFEELAASRMIEEIAGDE